MTTFTDLREASTAADGVIGWVVRSDLEPELGPRDWLVWRDQSRMDGFRYSDTGKFTPRIGESINYTPVDAPPAGSALEALINQLQAGEAPAPCQPPRR